MNVKLKKKLGAGDNGTVYISELDGVPAITKIEKFNGDGSTRSSFGRELNFAYDVKKMYPDKFMQIQHFAVVENCNHIQAIPTNVNDSVKKHIKSKNKLNKCSIISYTPILEFTWDNRPKLSKAQFKSAFLQLVEAIHLMKSLGYVHRDIYIKNIMGKKDGSNYKWFIIDYGSVWHPSFIKTKSDANFLYNDIIMLVANFMPYNPTRHFTQDKNKAKFMEVIKYIKKQPEYAEILEYVPDTGVLNIINEAVYHIAYLKFPKMFLAACKLDVKKVDSMEKSYISEDILLYAIKHSCENDCKKIIRLVKKFKV